MEGKVEKGGKMMNKFEQELFIRENPDAETKEDIDSTIIAGLKAIIDNHIESSHKYMVEKFIALCTKIDAEFKALAQDAKKYPCVQHLIPIDSLPPGSIYILEDHLKKKGFKVEVSILIEEAFELHNDAEFYKLKIWYERKEGENEENSENRDTELSESQKHND